MKQPQIAAYIVMHLDTNTLLYALWAVSAMCATGLWLGLDAPGMRALRPWFWAMLAHAGGWLTAILSSSIDVPALAALSITLTVAGMSLVLAAASRFLHAPRPHRAWFALPFAIGLLQCLLPERMDWIALAINGVISVQTLCACHLLWTHRTASGRWSRLALLALGMTLPFTLGHGLQSSTLTGWLDKPGLSSGFDDMGYLVDAASTVLLHMAFLLAYGQEAQAKLTILANRDALSGLLNRRAWCELTQRALSDKEPDGHDAIVLLDLDHFKKINDTHGHAIGDLAIKCLGDSARQTLRDHDIVGRYGGEEFSIFLPNIPPEALLAVDARLRAHFRGSTLRRIELAVSYSAGAAMLRPGENLDSAVARADAALYEAKRAGRDRMVFAAQGQREDGTAVAADL